MTLLSIIIPVYNASKTIERTLRSFKVMSERSKSMCELLIIDDGSTDDSRDIINSFQENLQSFNLRLLAQDNEGSANARNAALKNCSGTWILFLDADDELLTDPVPFIQLEPNATAIGFSVELRKKQKRCATRHPVHITPDNHLEIFTAKNPFTISSLVFKKDKIKTTFCEDYLYLEDWLFWIMNPAIFDNMRTHKNEILAAIHSHGKNKSSNRVLHGEYRKMAANKILADLDDILTPKQKNNLKIQSSIGMIQQESAMPPTAFFRFPCDPILYIKLILYFLRIAKPLQFFE